MIMGILSYFEDWPQTTVTVEDRTTTVVGGKPSDGWAAVTGLSNIPCWVYRAKDARGFLSDRFKNVAGIVLLFDPAVLGTVQLTNTMRVSINGVNWYFNTPDDISFFGEVIMVSADGEPHA